MDTISIEFPPPPAISYERLILSASGVIAALTTAGYSFTTTINREPDPVPGRPAYFVFIALHDNEANGLIPQTLVDIKITADAADPLVTVHDTFPGRYPAHIAKHETIERFKRRLPHHDFLFPMQVRL